MNQYLKRRAAQTAEGEPVRFDDTLMNRFTPARYLGAISERMNAELNKFLVDEA